MLQCFCTAMLEAMNGRQLNFITNVTWPLLDSMAWGGDYGIMYRQFKQFVDFVLLYNNVCSSIMALQHRVTKLSPRPVTEEALVMLFENSLTVY